MHFPVTSGSFDSDTSLDLQTISESPANEKLLSVIVIFAVCIIKVPVSYIFKL